MSGNCSCHIGYFRKSQQLYYLAYQNIDITLFISLWRRTYILLVNSYGLYCQILRFTNCILMVDLAYFII